MFSLLRQSIRAKMTIAMMATTLIALLITAVILVAYDYKNYRAAWVGDLDSQAEILGRASAPALEFDDPSSAQRYLQSLSARPRILTAAIYDTQGTLFATYARPGESSPALPRLPQSDGYRIDGDRLIFLKTIAGVDGPVGMVYLTARYQLGERLRRYMAIVGVVMMFSLLVALLVARWMQKSIAMPIVAISELAQDVKQRRDFSLRASKMTDDEVGDLVDSINDMLAELGRREVESARVNVTLAHEIAIREDAELALRAADQRKDEFLATLAHELRNPLAPLRNGLEILRLSRNDSDEALDARQVMDRQLRQLVRLVDDLLDVTRITTGKLTLRRENMLLSSLVATSLDAAAPFIEMHQHQLLVQIPSEPILMHVDAVRLVQVFVNLLHNAAKFTPPGGEILFAAERVDGTMVISVSDDGMGIPPEMLSVIFEMFTQLDQSLERPYSGLGIGLSLARRVVELHRGTLSAESAGTDKGSKFIVRLPITAPPEPSQA